MRRACRLPRRGVSLVAVPSRLQQDDVEWANPGLERNYDGGVTRRWCCFGDLGAGHSGLHPIFIPRRVTSSAGMLTLKPPIPDALGTGACRRKHVRVCRLLLGNRLACGAVRETQALLRPQVTLRQVRGQVEPDTGLKTRGVVKHRMNQHHHVHRE